MQEQTHSQPVAKGFLRNVSWYFLSAIGKFGTQIVLSIVLARLLTPADYGVFAGAMVVIGFGTLLSQLGISQAFIQAPDMSEQFAATAFSASVALSFLAAVGTYFCADLAAALFEIPDLAPVIRGLALIFFIMGASSIFLAKLDRQLRFKEIAIFRIIGFGAAGALSIGCALYGFGVWSLVVQAYTQHLIIFGLIFFRTDIRFRFGWNGDAARSIVSFGGHVTTSGFFNHLALQADNFVTGRFLGQSALGIYSVAYQLMRLPHAYVTSVVGRVFFPTASKLGAGNRSKDLHLKTTSAVGLVLAPVVTILMLQADVVIAALYGAQWKEAGEVLQILISVLIFRSSFSLTGDAMKAIGAVRPLTFITMIYALAVATCAYMGAQVAGLSGVAAGVCLAIVLNWIIVTVAHMRVTGITIAELVAAHVPWMLAVGAAVAVSMALQVWIDYEAQPLLTFGMICGIAVGMASVVLIWLPNPHTRVLLDQFKGMYRALRRRWTGRPSV